MIILHAGWEAGELSFWGEIPAPLPAAVPLGRKRTAADTKELPYDAGAERLSSALGNVFTGPVSQPLSIDTGILWLPTIHEQPIPSSPLIADVTSNGTPPAVHPWGVTTVTLPSERTIDFLCACIGKETLAQGVVIGQTLRFWASGIRLAGALVAREQFLPHVDQSEDGGRACWKAVVAGEFLQRLARFAAAMPAGCRALNTASSEPPQRAAAAVLNEFLAAMVDGLVRGSVATAPTPALKPAKFDSIHDQWLHALCSGAGQMTANPTELAKLAEQVETWQRPIAVSVTVPYRLCFRLEEPSAHSNGHAADDWTVRYLLQAQDDPSLLVPVADAWKDNGRSRRLLRRQGFAPKEYLLSALGQAASLCPRIEASLKSSAPEGYAADATEANQFLTETAWLLEQAGYGVLLPAWWTRKGTKQRLTLRAVVKAPKLRGGTGLSLDEIVHFDWQAALGDHALARADLEALAQAKAPLVQVRGQWVQVNAAEIQAALDFWKNKKAGQASVREVIHMALGGSTAPSGLEISGVEATGWIGEFLARLEGRGSFEELPPPASFQGTLRPYQVRGYSWLAFLRQWGLGACLADDMGLGKTVQTLALIQRDWIGTAADARKPALLICPTSVVGNWRKEAERFTPELPVLVHHGIDRSKGASFARRVRQQALVVSSYALLHRDLEILQKVPWGGLILDEAQNIKNPETKQAKAARGLSADYRIALTGTPVENHVGDLWSLGEFLNPGFLGNHTEFRRRFYVPIQAQQDAEAAERLKRLTGPFLLRRLKTDPSIISDLPDKLEMKVYCTLTKEQASLYAAVVADLEKALKKADGIQRKGIVLATLSKLKQVCNHPAQFLGDNSPIPNRSGKLARLGEMLDEAVQQGDRALLFTQFAEMGGILQRHLQEQFGQEVLFLHGGIARKQRDRLVERFQATDGPRLFVLSLKAGGTGLNLTAARHVFHFDRWWNPAVENQATDRAYRIGQTRQVQVHKFVCVGTLEEKIDEMIERKKAVAAKVVGSGEAWLTELSNDQLRELFALRKEALGE